MNGSGNFIKETLESTPALLHVRTQKEDGHLSPRKWVLTRHRICWGTDAGILDLRTVRHVCCLSHLIYDNKSKIKINKIKNGLFYVPIKFYLWTMILEFHIIFTRLAILVFDFSPPSNLKMQKGIYIYIR